MKVVFFLLAVFGLSYGAVIPTQPKDLNQDLQDFIDLVPTDEILSIVLANLDDPEVQATIEFFFSEEFKSLVVEVEAFPEYENVIAFLAQTGLPVREWIQALHDLIGLRTASRSSSRSLNDILNQIIAILPIEKIKALYFHKLETSPDFKNLVDQLQSPTFKGFVAALKNNKRIQEISARLKAAGIDVDLYLQLLKDFFGFESKSVARDLNQDLQDFIDLIPTDEILAIVLANLEDPEVQAVIAFIFSEEFKALVVEVEAIPEYETVIAFLENTGLPVRRWIAWLHELIGLSRVSAVRTSQRGLNAIINQIIAILPLEEIKALYFEKLQSSPDFKNLVDQIQSPTFKGFVAALKNNKRIQEISARLKAVGIDVDAFLQLLKDFFGFESKSVARDLNQDLQDFIDLIPTDEILAIVLANLEDPEVQAVIAFIFSEEFKALVVEVEAIPEYETVIAFLENTGLPVRRWIAWLHELIGLSRVSAVRTSQRGLNAIINQILAILPLEEIKALYFEKLQSSPDFKNLVDQIQSPTFKGFVAALKNNKRIQEISARLKAVGIDVDAFLQLLKDFFGFESKSVARDLNQDLQDFIDLIPTDEILAIVLANLEDPEVQAVIAFIFSEEFKALVVEVEAIPEYETVIVFLENTGLPVRRWIAWLHELIGLSRVSAVRTSQRGLNAIINQILAILPLEEIKALYFEKLQSSPDFKNLVDQIQSPTFKGFVAALKNNKRIQEISARLKAVGIDVDAFLQLLKDFFGFESKSVARDLNQDLQDFIDLIPTDEILAIVLANLEDPEVQAVIAFIFSEEFKALVIEVEAIPEYETIIAFLENTGLPVRRWIAWLHELIGLSRVSAVRTSPRGLNAIIQQIKAILPLEEIKALYFEKLQSSPDFKNLVDQIQSPTFKGFVEALKANKRIQEIAARLKAVGIDIDGFLQLIKDFFGFN